jgi:hypothetical protein
MDLINYIKAECEAADKELTAKEKGTDQEWNRAYGAYFALKKIVEFIEDHPEDERPEDEESDYPELSDHPDYQVLRVYMQTIEEQEE